VAVLHITQGDSFKCFLLNGWPTGTDWIWGCVDPKAFWRFGEEIWYFRLQDSKRW